MVLFSVLDLFPITEGSEAEAQLAAVPALIKTILRGPRVRIHFPPAASL
jgi:hypothetical protein